MNIKTEESFYEWLLDKYIDKEIYTQLNHVETIFKLNETMQYDIIENNFDNKNLELFLSNYSFVFI